MTIVLGHKNPDSDSVISAFVMANVLNSKNNQTKAAIAGPVNKETSFIFSYFQENIPPLFSEIDSGEEDIILIDHNDLSQSLVGAERVKGVFDHHALAGITTSRPIAFRSEVLGSSASLVYKVSKEEGYSISKKEAGLLLAAILSDTLKLSSPTTTEEDKIFVQELSSISGEDINILSEKMFAAKSDFSDLSLREVMSSDLKEFDLSGNKVLIAVAETTSLDYFEKHKQDIRDLLEKIKEEKSVEVAFFGAVDIINKNTWFFPASLKEEAIIKKAFQVDSQNEYFLLPGVVSRKSEILPVLSDFFAEEDNSKL